MSMIWNYLERAWEGVIRYMSQNHLIVILVAVLLFLWLMEKKTVTTGQNRILIYSVVMILLLICPVTAAGIMVYQTGFYDYEWAFSMLPLTAVVACGLVVLWGQVSLRKYKTVIALAMLVICCLCGNKGQIQKVSAEESAERIAVKEIIQVMDSWDTKKKLIAWAPSGIMQELRRQDGRILLVYGRDMWDEKAGAYDYEAYSPELEKAYLWMEKGDEYCKATIGHEKPEKALENFVKESGWDTEIEQNIQNILQSGANMVVLPDLLNDYVIRTLQEQAEANGQVLRETYIQNYGIYVIR